VNIQIKGREYEVSEKQIQEARSWVSDCLGGWTDLEDENDISELSDQEILIGVNRHYSGGLASFLADGN
jgi:hypothetical protein